jgi:hypothetical protein
LVDFAVTHGATKSSPRLVELILAFFESFDFSLLTIYLPLLLIHSLVLLVLLHFLPLKLIANQSAPSQAEQTANRRASSRMADRRANKASRRGATECADTCSLFTRR